MQWQVGQVRITKIVELETVGSTRFILPLATREEIQKLPWLMAETRRQLFSRFADRPVLLIGGHFDAGHLKRDGEAFKFVGGGASA